MSVAAESPRAPFNHEGKRGLIHGYYQGPRLANGATSDEILRYFEEQIAHGNVRLEWTTSELCERSVKLRMSFKTGVVDPPELSQEFFYTYDPNAKKWKNVIVLGSQVGCSLECLFCVSSEIPMQAQLSPEQLLFVTDRLLKNAAGGKGIPAGEPIRINFTGEGDPGANARNVAAFIIAVRQLDDRIRRVMVSTAGVLAGIKIFKGILPKLPRGFLELQTSLHIRDTEKRSKVIEKPKELDVEVFIKASEDFSREAGTKGRINIAVMPGWNTLKKYAKKLAKLSADHFYITLVPVNPAEVSPRLRKAVPAESLTCNVHQISWFKRSILRARRSDNQIAVETPQDRAAILFSGGCGQASSHVSAAPAGETLGEKFAYLLG